MPHLIEAAKSGRAACRSCRSKIAKGELRFGLESDYEGHTGHRWYHIQCAAGELPEELAEAVEAYDGEIPAELLAPKKQLTVDDLPFDKGDYVVVNDQSPDQGRVAFVFWVGEDKKSGAARVGLAFEDDSNRIFRSAVGLEPRDGAADIQASASDVPEEDDEEIPF